MSWPVDEGRPHRRRGLPRLAHPLPAARDQRPHGGRRRDGTPGPGLHELVADADAVHPHRRRQPRRQTRRWSTATWALRATWPLRSARPADRSTSSSPTPPRSATALRTPRARQGAADVLRALRGGVRRPLHRRAAAQPLRRARPTRLQLVRGVLRRRGGPRRRALDRRPADRAAPRPGRGPGARRCADDPAPVTRAAGHRDLGAARLGDAASVPRDVRRLRRRARPSPTSSRSTSSTPTARRFFPPATRSPSRPTSDQRGRFVETVRSHGNGGQTFVSTTVPGVTRGEHYHLAKIERFVVLRARRRSRCGRCSPTRSWTSRSPARTRS